MIYRFGFILIVGLLLASCDGTPATRRYALKGIVRGVDRNSRVVQLDHEAIPGYMAAMTMAYFVPEQRLILSLQRGDHIEATVVVGDHRTWLEDVRVTERAPSSSTAPGAGSEIGERVIVARPNL